MWTPTIQIETNSGTREVTLRSWHLSNRKIFIDGEITAESANEFAQEMMYLAEEPDREVDIYINSPGGEVTAGLMIFDILRSSRLTVNMYCTGMAASMAAVILAGGQKGRRFILPHSKVMIHEPRISGGIGGSATSIRTISDSILETRRMMNEILAECTGRTPEEMDEATSYDHFMNAGEAVEFGICDSIKEVV